MHIELEAIMRRELDRAEARLNLERSKKQELIRRLRKIEGQRVGAEERAELAARTNESLRRIVAEHAGLIEEIGGKIVKREDEKRKLEQDVSDLTLAYC